MAKRIKKHFSVGNLLALAALFVALGGSAYAGVKIGTSGIKNGAVTAVKLDPNFIQWARISAAGDELNGRYLFTSQRIGTGHYVVNFGRRTSECAINATPQTENETAERLITATTFNNQSDSLTNYRQVEVWSADLQGNPADTRFFLTVVCGQTGD